METINDVLCAVRQTSLCADCVSGCSSLQSHYLDNTQNVHRPLTEKQLNCYQKCIMVNYKNKRKIWTDENKTSEHTSPL